MAQDQKLAAAAMTFGALKEQQRAIRDGFPGPISLHVHSALSWLGRSQGEADDADVRFILLWVGFNSAYARELSADVDGERGVE